MRLLAGADERDVCGQREVAGGFSPDKVKGVTILPHVRAASGDSVNSRPSIESNRSGVQNGPHVDMVFENPYRGRIRPDAQGAQ